MAVFTHRFINKLTNRFTTKINRPLVQGEIDLAFSVFGKHLDIKNIRLKAVWWVPKNYAISPNGNVYFHPHNLVDDFSQHPLSTQAWFIHELAHVWQIQQGIKVVRNAILDRRYSCVIKQDKSFFQYGIEQQASIVEHYFIRRQQGKPCEDLQRCIPFL